MLNVYCFYKSSILLKNWLLLRRPYGASPVRRERKKHLANLNTRSHIVRALCRQFSISKKLFAVAISVLNRIVKHAPAIDEFINYVITRNAVESLCALLMKCGLLQRRYQPRTFKQIPMLQTPNKLHNEFFLSFGLLTLMMYFTLSSCINLPYQ